MSTPPPGYRARLTRFGAAVLEQLTRLWADIPEWYRAAALAIAALFVTMLLLLIALTLLGIAQRAPTLWGALLVAGTTLATFCLGRLAQELERRDQRKEARIDLAMALYAEIWSNVSQQRRALTADIVARKIESEFGKAPLPSAPAATAATEHKAGTIADTTNPIFTEAIKHYEHIPHECILAVVLYHNLNGMLNQSTGAISERDLTGLRPDQKAQTLIAYFELANKVDTSGMWALRKLDMFIPHSRRALLPRLAPPGFKFHKSRYGLLTDALPNARTRSFKRSHIEMNAQELAANSPAAKRAPPSSTDSPRSEGSDPS